MFKTPDLEPVADAAISAAAILVEGAIWVAAIIATAWVLTTLIKLIRKK